MCGRGVLCDGNSGEGIASVILVHWREAWRYRSGFPVSSVAAVFQAPFFKLCPFRQMFQLAYLRSPSST